MDFSSLKQYVSIEGENAILRNREIMGATNPKEAEIERVLPTQRVLL